MGLPCQHAHARRSRLLHCDTCDALYNLPEQGQWLLHQNPLVLIYIYLKISSHHSKCTYAVTMEPVLKPNLAREGVCRFFRRCHRCHAVTSGPHAPFRLDFRETLIGGHVTAQVHALLASSSCRCTDMMSFTACAYVVGSAIYEIQYVEG
jgi:hypothetical protein